MDTVTVRRQQDELVTQTSETCEVLRDFATQRASFERLPVEILTMIFMLVLAQDHAHVVTLAQINQDLRRIVVTIPDLWSTISLSHWRDPPAKARLWLSRNNGLIRGLYLRDYTPQVQEAVKILSNIPCPWGNLRTVWIAGYEKQCLETALPLLTPSIISNLESLTLRKCKCHRFNGSSSLRLHCFRLHSTGSDWAHLAKHSTHLRHLSYRGPLAADAEFSILSLLHRNPYLRFVELIVNERIHWAGTSAKSAFPYAQDLEPIVAIELVHLTALTLGGPNLKAKNILPLLFLPNLRHLELSGLCDEWDDTINGLISADTIGRLESLSIVYYRYATSSAEARPRSDLFIALLRHAKRLRYLEFFRVTHVGPVLQSLADVPLALCPELRTLDISQCPLIDDTLLETVVRARNGISPNPSSPSTAPAIHALNHLIVGSYHGRIPTEATLSWLRERVPRVTCHQHLTRTSNHRPKYT